QFAERPIDQLMALYLAQSFEHLRHGVHTEVPAPVACARVARVQMAVVDQLDVVGLQRELQCDANAPEAIEVAGHRHLSAPPGSSPASSTPAIPPVRAQRRASARACRTA